MKGADRLSPNVAAYGLEIEELLDAIDADGSPIVFFRSHSG